MIGDFSIFDADAHAMMCPKMWEELPAAYAARRPRPVRIEDSGDLGRWTNGWLIEGRLLPAPFGPGAQPGNEPKRVLRTGIWAFFDRQYHFGGPKGACSRSG